jgi:tRNA/tmRNA/rRNA uracil-C5-methylase (TrmA/RlmC/RlmD family)
LIDRVDFLRETLIRQNELYAAIDGQAYPPPKGLVRRLSEKTPDIVVLDPSSKGAKPEVLQTILDVSPRKIIYVSCNPATLARDLLILIGTGVYTIQRIKPIDMFPQTAHVETIVTLKR